MESYKQEFIEFMVESDVLKFGDFTLKSGRKSPFFMNAGAYVTGTQLMRLGEYYAKAIHDNYGTDFKLSFAINSSDSADGFLFDSFCAFSRISIRCSAVNNKPLRDYSKAGVQSDFKPNH